MSGGEYSKQIDNFNKKNKADIELRKCLRCLNFNKQVYKCKLKECNKK